MNIKDISLYSICSNDEFLIKVYCNVSYVRKSAKFFYLIDGIHTNMLIILSTKMVCESKGDALLLDCVHSIACAIRTQLLSHSIA